MALELLDSKPSVFLLPEKMRNFYLEENNPVSFLVCGMLFSKNNFLHMKRQFSDNVLILVKKGTLHICSNNVSYDLNPNQFIFLKAGELHYGTKESSGPLEYYWVHINNNFKISKDSDINQQSNYCFPESGIINNSNKIILLFNQLLDFYMTDSKNKMLLDYSASLLFLELTAECKKIENKNDYPSVLYNATTWIKANYSKDFSIQELADFLECSQNYVTNMFKKHLNMSIIQYTNKIRINAAKNLIAYFNHTIKECAWECGFEDEKYFMKIFKKIEGITPTQYKQAFSLKNVNS